MVLRESLGAGVVAPAVGPGVVVATMRLVQSLLFGVSPHDASTILSVALGLIISALIAAWLLFRRASGIDPMAALAANWASDGTQKTHRRGVNPPSVHVGRSAYEDTSGRRLRSCHRRCGWPVWGSDPVGSGIHGKARP
jgi:hypothetical protein